MFKLIAESPITETFRESAEKAFGADAPAETTFMSELAHVALTLIFLVAGLIVLTYLAKRMMYGRIQHANVDSDITILESRTLSTRTMLHLVEVEGKKILLGESQGNIQTLSETDV